jgi:hypothetical protein
MEQDGRTRQFLEKLNLPSRDIYPAKVSSLRFADHGQYRIEIPEVETPLVFEAVVKAAGELGVPIHRVSQGTGITLLTDDEIRTMAKIGARENIEVFLFVKPEVMSNANVRVPGSCEPNLSKRFRGADELVYAIEDIKRACELGIRGVLLADEGLIHITNAMRQERLLPEDLVIKSSVSLAYSNPASAKILESLGVDSFNICTGLSLPMISSLRQAVTVPLDIYIEAPAVYGGAMRYHELPEIIKTFAPVYIKFGLCNEVTTDPVGEHLMLQAIEQGRERVRRAKIARDIIARQYPDAKPSPVAATRSGIPRPASETVFAS